MSYARLTVLTSLAMIAFACNSLLCRFALKETGIDATSFTTIRLVSGAVILFIAALGGILFLGESVTLRLVFASLAILGGIALVVMVKQNGSA